jgi:hypothetical protein
VVSTPGQPDLAIGLSQTRARDWIRAYAEKHPSHGNKVLGGMTEQDLSGVRRLQGRSWNILQWYHFQMVTLDSGSRKGADSSKSKQSVFGRKEQQIQESKRQETYGQKHFRFFQKGSTVL